MRFPTRATFAAVLTASAALALAGCQPPETPRPVDTPQEPAAAAHHRGHAHHHGRGPAGDGGKADTHAKAAAVNVPDKVTRVLRHVDEHHRAPDGFEGGRTFHNAGRAGEKALPRADADGKEITYREWDVNPKKPGVNRGAERLVTGSDGSAYFTEDHYRTFKKVR